MKENQKDDIFDTLNILREDLFGQEILSDKLQRVAKEAVSAGGADLAGIWLARPGDLCETGCVHSANAGLPAACLPFGGRPAFAASTSGAYLNRMTISLPGSSILMPGMSSAARAAVSLAWPDCRSLAPSG